MNTALRNTIIGLSFLIPFIPLIVAGSLYFPYITGKAFAFRTLVEIALILYTFLVIRDRSFLPKKSAILWSLSAFVGILGLATIFSENPMRSFWSNYERMEGYITILHLLAYFIILAGVFSKRTWYWFAHTSLAASIIIGLRGFADTNYRIAGTLGNSTYLGVYALLHMFIAGAFMLRVIYKKVFAEAIPWIAGYAILIVFNAWVLFKTGTRGSFVGLVGGALITAVLLALFERTNKIVRYTGIGMLAAVVLVVGSLGLARNTSFVQNSDLLARFSSLITTDIGSVLQNQGYARSVIWSMASNGFKERPILGWGQDNFNYVFAKYYDPRMYNQEQWFDRSHNVLFDWLIAGGILGLAGYLSLFAAALYMLWRRQQSDLDEPWMFAEKAILTGLLIAYFIHNLFVFDHLVSYLIFFALLAYVHYRSTSTQFSSQEAHRPLFSNEGTQLTVGSIAALAIVSAMYIGVVQPYRAASQLIDGLQAQVGAPTATGEKISDYKSSLQHFKNVFALNTFGNAEARERLSEVAASAVSDQKLDDQTKIEFVKLTQEQFAQAGRDPRPVLFYALFLQRIGQRDEALKHIDQSLVLSPKKQSFLFQKALIHFEKQEFAQAVESAKSAYELEPSYDEALIIYAATLIYNNQSDQAEKEIEAAKARGLDVSGDERIMQAYIDKGQNAKVLASLRARVAANPQDPQLRVSLAAAYLKVGDRVNAIKEVQEAIKLEPAFKQQGEFFISEIRAGRDPSQSQK